MQKLQPPVQKEQPEINPDNLKVVLDTNILVSALFPSQGKSSDILSLVLEGKLQACYSQKIMDEYDEVLSRDKFKRYFTSERKQTVLNELKDNGLVFDDVTPSNIPMKDETDRVFYDVAKASGAYLITNNIKDFPEDSSILMPENIVDRFIDPFNKSSDFYKAQVLERLRRSTDR